MTNYHPDAQWLSEYVAGTLADSQALCVTTHMAYCTQCKTDAANLTHFGATLFNHNTSHSEPSAESLQQILSDIDRGTEQNITDVNSTGNEDRRANLPPVIEKLIQNNQHKLNWRKIGSKISIAKLGNLGDRREITLHKLQPGSSVSDHDHRGREITVVLQGSFSDDDGQYHTGDFLVRDPGETHQPRASNNEECLCLAVCDAPVKFTGIFARLFNPLLALQHKHKSS